MTPSLLLSRISRIFASLIWPRSCVLACTTVDARRATVRNATLMESVATISEFILTIIINISLVKINKREMASWRGMKFRYKVATVTTLFGVIYGVDQHLKKPDFEQKVRIVFPAYNQDSQKVVKVVSAN